MSDPAFSRSPVAHDPAGDPDAASPASSRKEKGFRKRVKSAMKKALHLSGKDTRGASGVDTASTGTPTSPWPEHTDVDYTTPTPKTPRTPTHTRRVAVDATLEGEEHVAEGGGGSGTPSQHTPDAHARRHKEHKGFGKLIQKCMKTDAADTDSNIANVAAEPPPAAADIAAPTPPAPEAAAPPLTTPALETKEIAAAPEAPTPAALPHKPAEELYADAVDTLPLPQADVTAPFASASSTTLPLSPITAGDTIELPASTGPLGLSPSPVRTRSPALKRLPSPTPAGRVPSAATGAYDRPPSPPPPAESIIADDAVLSSATRQGPPPPLGVPAFEGHQLPSDLTEEDAITPPPRLSEVTATTAPEVAAQARVAQPAIPWSDQQQAMLAPPDALGIPMHAPEGPAIAPPRVTAIPHAGDVAIQLPLPAAEHAPSPATGVAAPETHTPAGGPAIAGEHAERAQDMAKLTHGDALRQQSSSGSGALSGAARELPPPSDFIPPPPLAGAAPAKAGQGDALKTSRSPAVSSDLSFSGTLPQSTAAAERDVIEARGMTRHKVDTLEAPPPPSEVLAGIPPLQQVEHPFKAGQGDALTQPPATLPASPAPLEVAGRAPHVTDAAKTTQGDALLSQAPLSASSFEAAYRRGDFEPYRLTHGDDDLEFRKMSLQPMTPTPTPNLSVSESLLQSDAAYGSPPRPGMLGVLADGARAGEAYRTSVPPTVQVPQYDAAALPPSSASLGTSQGLSKGLPCVPEQEAAEGEFAEKSEEPFSAGADAAPATPEIGGVPAVDEQPTAAAFYQPEGISPNTLDGTKAVGSYDGAEYEEEGGMKRVPAAFEGGFPGAAAAFAPPGIDTTQLGHKDNVYMPVGEEVPGPMEPYAVLARPLDSPLLQTSGSVSSSCGYLAMPPVSGLHVVKEGSAELEGEGPEGEEVIPGVEAIGSPALEFTTAPQPPIHGKIAPDEIRPVSKFESMESAPPRDSSAGKTSRHDEISSQLIPDVPKSFTATSTSASSRSSATTPRHPDSTPPTPPGTPSVLTSLQQITPSDSRNAPVSTAAKGDLTTEYLKGQEDVSGAHLGGLTSFPAKDVAGEASAPETPAKADERDVTAMYLKGQENVEGAHLAGLTSFPTDEREGPAVESPRAEPPETPHSEAPEPSLGSITIGRTGSANEIGNGGTPSGKTEDEGALDQEVAETSPAKEVREAAQGRRSWASALTVQAARTAGAATGIVIGVTQIIWQALAAIRSGASNALESAAERVAGCTLTVRDYCTAYAITARESAVSATQRSLQRLAPARVASDVAVGVRAASGWLLGLLSLLLAMFLAFAATAYTVMQMASRLVFPERMEVCGHPSPHEM